MSNPAVTPDTFPEPSIVALPLVMLQEPPDTESMIEVILPVQTLLVPVIIEGSGLIVTIAVTKQPRVEV